MSKYCFYVFRPPPPLPLPLSSGLGSTPRVTISTLPYPLLTKNQRWRLRRYELEQGAVACPPKYAQITASFLNFLSFFEHLLEFVCILNKMFGCFDLVFHVSVL